MKKPALDWPDLIVGHCLAAGLTVPISTCG
jgi:hypothetical protein